MGDHSVQAAYLGRWSFTGNKDRSGKVYAFKANTHSKGWFPVAIDNILNEKRGDKLTAGEIRQLNDDARQIKNSSDFRQWSKHPQMELQRLLDLTAEPIGEASLDKDLLHPIESQGYAALCEAAEDPDGIKHRPPPWLIRR